MNSSPFPLIIDLTMETHTKRGVDDTEMHYISILSDSGFAPRFEVATKQPDGTWTVEMEHTGRALATLSPREWQAVRARFYVWLSRLMEYLSRRGMYQYDAHAGNFTLTDEGEFRMIDFGQMRRARSDPREETEQVFRKIDNVLQRGLLFHFEGLQRPRLRPRN